VPIGDDSSPLFDGLGASKFCGHCVGGQLVGRDLQHGDVEVIVDIDPLDGSHSVSDSPSAISTVEGDRFATCALVRIQPLSRS